ncbi:MAG TPA: adenylate/guanylate cyclase domain-containing protein [Rhizomicrobium sp.]|nr:adenylate/guanylate cyclase domain-containing protein [Rhizomicrobium sp.]
MQIPAKTATVWAIPLAILVVFAIVLLGDPGGLATHLRGVQYDTYQRWKPREYEDTAAKSNYAVRVLTIDRASIERFGPWPWSRAVLAKLTDEMKAAGASIVIYDFPLDAPDPNTPEHLAGLFGKDGAAQIAKLPSPDTLFATSLGGIKAVTGFTLGEIGNPPQLKATFDADGATDALRGARQFQDVDSALPIFEAKSAGIGALNLEPDSDGHLRSLPVVFRLKDTAVPSLEAEAIRLVSAKSAVTIRADDNGWFGSRMTSAEAGSIEIPIRSDGTLAIYYSGPDDQRLVSAFDLDEGALEPGVLKNAIVYISPPAARALTPSGMRPEGEVRAEAMENILLGNSLKDASNLVAELLFLAVAGAGLVVLFARAGVLWAAVLAIVAILGAQASTWFLFANARLLIDSMNPSIAIAAAFLGGLATRAAQITHARAELQRSFADALPLPALEQIARTPSLLKMDGETRTISYLSCTLRGYARLLESFAGDAVGFTRLMSRTMSPLLDAAVQSGGTVAYFSGERFAAFWNAPLDDPEHAIHACEAANRMSLTLARVNEELSRERRTDGTAFESIEIGIGISTGPAIAGGFANGRNAYSVSGDCAIVAERIRDLSVQYGPAIVVSEDTRKAAERGFAFLEVDYIAAGAEDQPIKLYAMLGNPLVRASPKFRALSTFHEHIFNSIRTQQWRKARLLIEQCRKLSGASQRLYDLHLARIDWYEKHPPGATWDGAFRPVLR